MLSLAACLLLVPWVQAALHHLYVGSVDGSSIYALELEDEYRTIDIVQNSTAAGAASALVLDRSRKFLFSSRPSDGTVSRYLVNPDYSLIHEGTMDVPKSCNTTSFKNIKLTSGPQPPSTIFGSASTGSCSAIFSTSVSGYYQHRSSDIAGDVRSLVFSPDGHHLRALDFKRNSIMNFIIREDTDFDDLNGTDVLTDVTTSRQIISHPGGHRLYVVTQDTNELIDLALLSTTDRVDSSLPTRHHTILPKDTKPGEFFTSSVAIPSANTTLWTLSQSSTQAQITVFKLDPVTGEVKEKVARAGFKNAGGSAETVTSALSAAPFGGNLVAVTTYPGGMVAVMGLDETGGTVKIKSYGRAVITQDAGCCGEAVWVN
ncbi:hypothetical protein BU24DRAFT_459841 [Aaosphaeria arxii CBS 175.79]|uniref:Isomerase YbhE n=1 Tax=Aaosphaeria arxii CBS 175.79 TaxID=1450172 RepID=A0A6A5Y3U9_9PLEO|nr:uncharacterized protein BU24DRAFT_459841 [Aaosphaeria arxii CBS 175.79]KAF2020245.1 hypothetical protein BU24DRAFT_459841 [Aaosphaeria arxii CBS 175.79]